MAGSAPDFRHVPEWASRGDVPNGRGGVKITYSQVRIAPSRAREKPVRARGKLIRDRRSSSQARARRCGCQICRFTWRGNISTRAAVLGKMRPHRGSLRMTIIRYSALIIKDKSARTVARHQCTRRLGRQPRLSRRPLASEVSQYLHRSWN